MFYKKIILLVIFFCFSCVFLFSQNDYLAKAKSYYVLDSNMYYGEKNLQYCLDKSVDAKKQIEAYSYLVSIYLNKEKFTKARNLVQEMRLVSSKLNNKEMQYVSIGLLGDVEKYSKNYSKAVNYYLQSYDLLEKNKSWDYLFKCSIDLVEFNRAIANFNDAEVYIKKAFNTYYSHQLNDLVLLARLYNRIAAVKNETGSIALIDSSIVYSKKALLINTKLSNVNGQAITWNELGYSYRHLQKIDSAEICFKKAENIWFSIGAPSYAINAMNNRAGLYGFYNIKSNERINLYFEILNIIKQQHIDYDIHLVYNGLSEEYNRKNDIKNAFKYYLLYHEAYCQKLDKIYFLQTAEIKEQFENEKIKKEITSISGKLDESQELLLQKERENKIIYLSIAGLIILLGIIGYLWYKNYQANIVLQQKNNQKDILVQEIHHRVKNNLQFVSSLINMQINSSSNETEIYSLGDASRRIRSMALVHEMLYNQDEVKGISIKQYLTELTQSINDLINSKKIPITFELQINDVYFGISQATALGMITSELISNSIKYAFNGVESPVITIKLSNADDNTQLVYTVKDNGCGLTDVNEDKNKLGMRLVNIFSRQLKGEYQFSNNNGLQYDLTFKL